MTLCRMGRRDRCAVQCQACAQREAVCADPIVESVVTELRARSAVGVRKYGVTLERTDLDHEQWMQHLFEEMADALLYIKRIMLEYDAIRHGTRR